MRRSLLAAIAAAAVLAGVAVAAVAVDGGTTGVSRVEAARQFGPTYACHLDDCGVGSTPPVRVELPAGVDRVDLTVTVSMSVTVSRGDRGSVRVRAREEGAGTGRVLAPGAFRLRAPGGRATSTTVVWTALDLPADGRTYLFDLEAGAVDGDGDDRFETTVGRHTVVVESWTAG